MTSPPARGRAAGCTHGNGEVEGEGPADGDGVGDATETADVDEQATTSAAATAARPLIRLVLFQELGRPQLHLVDAALQECRPHEIAE